MGDLQLVFLQYVNKTPTLAGCAKCQLKFFTPQQLMKQPQAAAEYLREKFALQTCKGEIFEETRPGTLQARQLRIVKRTDDTSALGVCEVCHMRFLVPVYLRGHAHLAEKDIWRQFERHSCTRRDAS
jgi:hypothetical protein